MSTETEVMTNKKFAEKDESFIVACERAGVKNTARQASKWRMKFGKAYKEGREKV